MKNHIAFKFLAIFVCALALLSSVVSTGAIVALTGAGLYDKTVQQVREGEIRSWGQDLASGVAMYYSSVELGGCPESLVQQHINSGEWYYSGFNWDKAGYALKDAQGTVLETYGALSEKDAVPTYSFPVSGQYLYLVSTEPKNQNTLYQSQEDVVEPRTYTDDQTYIYNAIGTSGSVIYSATFWGPNGQLLYNHPMDGQPLGVVMYDQQGNVLYRSLMAEYADVGEVTQLELVGIQGDIVYEAYSAQTVGNLGQDSNGMLVYQALGHPELEAMTAATEPETLQQTQPETQAATQPQTEPETQPEATESETQPEETHQESETQPEEGEPESETQAEETDQETQSQSEETDGEPEQQAENGEEQAEGHPDASNEDPEAAAQPETVPETQPETVPQTVPETQPEETIPDPTAPVLINGRPVEQYDVSRYEYTDSRTGTSMVAKCVYVPMPEMTLEVYLVSGGLQDDGVFALLDVVRGFRSDLFLILGVSLLLFVISGVYLVCAAGRRPGSGKVAAGGLNRMPLDLYLVWTCVAIAGTVVVLVEGAEIALEQNLQVGCVFGGGVIFLACLIFVGFCFAFTAQIKMNGGFWWRNTVCVRLLMLLGTGMRWVAREIFPVAGTVLKGSGTRLSRLLVKLAQIIREKSHRFLSLLPLTWQWLVAGLGIFLLMLLAVASGSLVWSVLLLAVDVALILWGARSFGILMDSTRRMSRGDLNIRIDDKQMIGVFRDFGEDLNALAGVAVVAAQKQLKSERMKTELITNVSHDIKTPLTSIINYVDLLQRPHTQQEEQMYLEVLDRQSQRLKKLIEDLMDMSKANTGNMTVEITQLNAVESVNQALGEFADKLERAQLIPVFRHTEEVVQMRADGRLVWRVLSNLLSNAVKYAMPGTRLYVDLMQADGKVILSLKNISREELNVAADELMERFVRGDGSRNTEGSGLGLNIAKSLMELQKGQLELLVDGDLFKVTLIFPGA